MRKCTPILSWTPTCLKTATAQRWNSAGKISAIYNSGIRLRVSRKAASLWTKQQIVDMTSEWRAWNAEKDCRITSIWRGTHCFEAGYGKAKVRSFPFSSWRNKRFSVQNNDRKVEQTSGNLTSTGSQWTAKPFISLNEKRFRMKWKQSGCITHQSIDISSSAKPETSCVVALILQKEALE